MGGYAEIDASITAAKKYASKAYSKSILFSARKSAIFPRLNVVTKVFVLLMLSIALIRIITEPVPDIVLAVIVMVPIAILLYEAGSFRFILNFYMLGFVIAMLVLLFWWLLFNQSAGVSSLLFISFYGVSFRVTTLSLEIGLGKVAGYTTLFLGSLLVLMTTRDGEVVDFLNAARLPFRVVFFSSIAIRNLDLMSTEFESIRKAQIARGNESRSRVEIVTKFKDIIGISVPLTASMLRRSVEIGTALEARGFDKAKNIRNAPYCFTLRLNDVGIIILSVVMVAIAYTHNLTLLILK